MNRLLLKPVVKLCSSWQKTENRLSGKNMVFYCVREGAEDESNSICTLAASLKHIMEIANAAEIETEHDQHTQGGVRVSIYRQDVNLPTAALHFFLYKFCLKVDPLKICTAKSDKQKKKVKTSLGKVTYKRTAKSTYSEKHISSYLNAPLSPRIATPLPLPHFADEHSFA